MKIQQNPQNSEKNPYFCSPEKSSVFQNFYKSLFLEKSMIKRGRKGQVTIIIIIAVIIIAVALLTYFLWPQISSLFMNEQQSQRFLASQAEPLRQAVSDCVEEVSLDGFQKIGLQGGYYDLTGIRTLNYMDNDFAVVLFKDSTKRRINKLPSFSQLGQQYSTFLEKEGNTKIDACLNNLNSFKRVMTIEAGARTITPIFYEDSVSLIINWPMKLTKNDVVQNINQKGAELQIPLGALQKVASDIVDCDVQISCKFTGSNWDAYTWNNPYTLRYVNKQALNIDGSRRVFLLESIPYRTTEQPFKFYFAEDLS